MATPTHRLQPKPFLVVVCAIAVLATLLVPISAQHAEAQQVACTVPGSVNAGVASQLTSIRNMRTGPDYSCPVRALLLKNSPLQLHAQRVTNDGYVWAVVTAGSQRGWLAVERVDGSGNVLTTIDCTVPTAVEAGTDYRLTEARNMRSGPDFSCPVQTLVTRNSTMTVHPGLVTANGYVWAVVTVAGQRGWMAIRRADGTRGVLGAAVSCAVPGTVDPGVQHRLTSIRNMRTGSSFSCEVAQLLIRNSLLQVHSQRVTAESFIWAPVTANGQRGWLAISRADGSQSVLADAPGAEWTRLNPVTNLRVTATTSTSITVAWDADDDDRRYSFDFFVNNEWVTWTSDPHVRTHTFTGLSAGTSHPLGVTAVGRPSDPWPAQHFSPRVNTTGSTADAGETVVWEDTFDGLDLTQWKVEHSTYGDGNNEMQCYRPENVWVENGRLVLRAFDETYTCPNGDTRVVTSGMVRSKLARFSPGQAIEFRVKLTPDDPNNQAGLWPAVWASGWGGGGWPLGGEMDWLEVMTANDPRRSVYTVHYEQPDGTRGKKGQEHFLGENFSDSWHTIRFDYGFNGQLEWRLDGELVHTVTDAPTAQGWPVPFDSTVTEIKINLALGGNPGPLDFRALGATGATFEVDWVRILQVD